MAIRYYRNGPATGLTSSIGPSDVAMNVDDASGFPSLFPYTLILDEGEASEEVVDVVSAAGNLLTVTRAVDGTTAFAHTTGSIIVHGISARDPREANTHVNANSSVHGVTGDLVGTTMVQTLSGKTLTTPTINSGTINTAGIATPAITNGTMVGTAISAGSVAGTTAVTLTENSKIQPTTAVAKLSIRDNGGVERGFIEGTGEVTLPRLEVLATLTAEPTLKVKGVAAQVDNLITVQDSASLAALNVGADRRVGVNTAPGSQTTLYIRPVVSTDVGLRIRAAASQSANVLSIVNDAESSLMLLTPAGNLVVTGSVDSADVTDWATYTPLWANAGSATFNTRSGRWRRIGKKTVAFYIFVHVNAAGSGGSNVTTTLPTAPLRTYRQTFAGHAEGISASINAVVAVGGSGTEVDALLLNSSSGTGNITGAACTAGRQFTLEGIYEEA